MSFFVSPMSSYLGSFFGLRSEAGAPEASSSRGSRPSSRVIDDDDRRSIASDLPPSDDDEPVQRRPYSSSPGRIPQTQRAQAGAESSNSRTAGGSRSHRGQGPLVPDGRYAASAAPSMCVVCKKKPPFVNPTTGKQYPTCGNSCANALSQLCEVCYARPRSKPYKTCGLTCAKTLKAYQSLCLQCHAKPKAVDANGKAYMYCGKTCRDAARTGAALPLSGNPSAAFETLKIRAKGRAPCFLDIPKSHARYSQVLDFFTSDWDSRDRPRPNVIGIYSVVQSEVVLKKFDQYRDYLESKGLTPRDSRRWVGVKCSCQLKSPIAPACDNYGCGACDVLNRNAFGASEYPGAVPLSGDANTADSVAFPRQGPRYKGLKVLLFTKLIGNDDMIPRQTFQEAYASRENGQGKDIVRLTHGQNGRQLPVDQLLAFNQDAAIPRFAVLYQ